MDRNHILLGECKWTNRKIDKKVLDDLIQQGKLFSQENQLFYLFSKSGFTDAVLDASNENLQIRLFTIEDIWRSEN